jgi:hypothetical protein
MKIFIAKIFCLFTVLLLSSNVVLSSFPAESFTIEKDFKRSITDELELRIGETENSQFNFLAEKDPFEEFDQLLFIHLEQFKFDFSLEFQSESSSSIYSPYFFLGPKIPRWLWIRHILI